MLIKTVITLLRLFDGVKNINIDDYTKARLQLCGWIDDDNNLTPEGRMIVQEILSYVECVI